MGSILKGKCPWCEYQAEVHVGGGRGDFNPKAALNAVPQDGGLAAALGRGASYRIERCLAACANCRQIVTGTYVIYQAPGEDPGRAEGSCPNCGGPLRWYPPNAHGVSCPVCRHVMEMRPVGHWD